MCWLNKFSHYLLFLLIIYLYKCVFLSLFTVIMSNFYICNRSFPHYYCLTLPPKRQSFPSLKWPTDLQSESGFDVALMRGSTANKITWV